MKNLSFAQIYLLLQSVFKLGKAEKGLTIFTDLPTEEVQDNALWQDRRRIATEWFLALQTNIRALPFTSVSFCVYENVGSNNNDLPERVMLIDRCTKEVPTVDSQPIALAEVLASTSVVLSTTEFSSTAPLKVLAQQWKFRGATLPGFTREMLPALGLDYDRVNVRVMVIKERLDRAQSAAARFRVHEKQYLLNLDLRYRTGHASGGLMREPGIVANLPSGEAYIVPYEGEIAGEESLTAGELPVQFGDEVVLFSIKVNRAVRVTSIGPRSDEQRKKLLYEPAYGNIAELGLGVLTEFGIKAAGSTLIDEKLGFHLAFGRSDHFGGSTGPGKFIDPRNVIHVDWVYVPSVQPKVAIEEVTLDYGNDIRETVIQGGKLVV
jgi:leucyl aminopeptidase (aminopeptidase T)